MRTSWILFRKGYIASEHIRANAEEAVRIARLSRAMGCRNFVKVEIMRDAKYLFPDNYETIRATEILAKEGFVVFALYESRPECGQRSAKCRSGSGHATGSPDRKQQGTGDKEMIQILIDEIDLPIIVDAGIGKPSQACGDGNGRCGEYSKYSNRDGRRCTGDGDRI